MSDRQVDVESNAHAKEDVRVGENRGHKRTKTEAERTTKDQDIEAAAMTIIPPLSGNVLTLSAIFLALHDLGNATSVCKVWRHDLYRSSSVWLQVAKHTKSLGASVEAVLSSAVGIDLLKDDQHERTTSTAGSMDVRSLIAGLSIGERPEPELQLPEPKLKPTDLFFVVTIRRNMDVVCAYCCDDCTSWFDPHNPNRDVVLDLTDSEHYTQRLITVDGPNPLSREASTEQRNSLQLEGLHTPHLFALNDALLESGDVYTASLHLFRKDDGRSICVLDNKCIQDIREGEYNCSACGRVPFALSCLPFSAGESGAIARQLMSIREMKQCQMTLTALFSESRLPLPGSKEEMEWLKKLRRYVFFDRVQEAWTEEDEEEFSHIDRLELQMTEIEAFPSYNGFDENEYQFPFTSESDLLLILDGLDWT